MQQTLTRPDQSRKEYILTISSKGQVTLPVDVRRTLGVKQREKVTLVVAGKGDVRLQVPEYPNVDSVVGKAGKLKTPLSLDEIQRIANEDALVSDLHG